MDLIKISTLKPPSIATFLTLYYSKEHEELLQLFQ